MGFERHRQLEVVVKFRVELFVGDGGGEVAQAEPLARKILGEGVRLGIVEHALDLLAENVWLAQFSAGGEFCEGVVGGRAPEKVGKTGGQVEVVESAGGSRH